MTGHPPIGGDRGFALDDERHVGARSSHVEGDQVAVPENPACVSRRRDTAGRPGEHPAGREPDRVGHRREAAVRLHDEQRPGVPRLAQAFGETLEITLERRSDVRVDDGRADPLELLDLRKHVGRHRHVHRGQFAGERLGGPALVLRRAVRVEVAHRHRFDLFGGEGAYRGTQRAFLERRRRGAVGPNALAYRQAQMARHQGLRRRLAQRVAVVLEPFAHLQDVAMPFGGEQAEPRALALEQRIGRDGGAVDDALGRAEERSAIDSERCGKQLQSLQNADRLVPWGRCGFCGRDSTRVVDGDEIGERAADVDSDAKACRSGGHESGSPVLAQRGRGIERTRTIPQLRCGSVGVTVPATAVSRCSRRVLQRSKMTRAPRTTRSLR